jgi:ubiquinone biosynthesis monooxygenase Coq7
MSLADRMIEQMDRALRTLAATPQSLRENPAQGIPSGELSATEERHVAGLMRVNHTGEVCAQALYEGQALMATDDKTRSALLASAQEEVDHLVWCGERLDELNARPSVLNPGFYAASFAVGALTGLLGDKVSLGFVEATEDQVCEHLQEHLDELPEGDAKSRAIIERMYDDEARHGASARAEGATQFPPPVKQLMRLVSKAMTRSSYHL